MPPRKRHAHQHAKARRRRRRTAQERLERDRRQAQHAAQALEQALNGLGLPEDLVTEIEGRLRSQQQLLGKICGVMFPRCSGVAPTQNCAACEVGTRICPTHARCAAQALLDQAAPRLGCGGAGRAVASRRHQK